MDVNMDENQQFGRDLKYSLVIAAVQIENLWGERVNFHLHLQQPDLKMNVDHLLSMGKHVKLKTIYKCSLFL